MNRKISAHMPQSSPDTQKPAGWSFLLMDPRPEGMLPVHRPRAIRPAKYRLTSAQKMIGPVKRQPLAR